MSNNFKINNKNDLNYIKKVYERDYNMLKSVVFNSYIYNYNLNNNYNKILKFATEDIATYMKYLDTIENYLTVCGSSDQVINGMLFGAKNIDVFDINYFAKHALLLKMAAIQNLTREEFLSFYCEKFNYSLFFKIINNLNSFNNLFWNRIYNCYGNILINNLFYKNSLTLKQIVDINPYLQNNNYNIVRKMIENVNINFIESDLYNIIPFISEKMYNAINLSNIYEYINYDQYSSYKQALKYKKFIDYLVNNNLYDDGSIMFAYMYKWNKKVKRYFDIIYNTNKELVSIDDYNINNDLLERGMTYQNLSYSMLYDVLDNNFEEILTKTIIYGKSIEKNHDVALIIKKKRDI